MNIVEKFFNPLLSFNQKDLKGEVPPIKDLYLRTIKIAWPSALEGVLISLISAVDLIMVGSIGKEAISAVGICNQPRFICLSPIFASTTAAIVLIARRKGEGNQKAANDFLRVALCWSFIFALVFCGLSFVFAREILSFAGAQADYIDIAVEYYRIVVSSLFLFSLGNTMSGAQRGAGYTKISMITNLSANIVNIILNAILINGLLGFPKLGVKGAAIATAIGNTVAFIIALISLLQKNNYLSLNFKAIDDFKDKTKRYFNIFKSAFSEQIIVRFGFFVYAKVVASLGTAEFAAHQICMNIITINFALGDGLQTANTSLVGQSLGAKRSDLAIIYSKIAQTVGVCFAIFNAIVVFIFSKQLLSLFTSDPVVIELADIPMKIICFIVFFQILQVITIGALRGAGDVKFVTFMMLICVGIIRPGVSYLLVYPLNMGLVGAWLGVLIDQASRAIYSLIRFKKGSWVNIKV